MDYMIKIDVVCIGKLKEKYYKEAQQHYLKLLSRFAKVNVTEISDISLDNVKSEKEELKIKERECLAASKYLKGYVIALSSEGRKFTSEEFADFVVKEASATGAVTFVIGGSLGLDGAIKKRADAVISFSDMTMPHRLFRIVLLEQIFRAFKIANNETYHK